MKQIFILTIMLLMYVIPKAQKIKLAKEKNETTNYNKILSSKEINAILNAAIDNFNSLKTVSETDDEFHFGDNGYIPKYCLQGANKCELNMGKYMPQFAARFSDKIISQKEAFALYDSLFNYFSNTPLVWGISEISFMTDNESGKASTFKSQTKVDTDNKFKDISISIKTNYIDDDKFQVLMYIGK